MSHTNDFCKFNSLRFYVLCFSSEISKIVGSSDICEIFFGEPSVWWGSHPLAKDPVARRLQDAFSGAMQITSLSNGELQCKHGDEDVDVLLLQQSQLEKVNFSASMAGIGNA